LAFCAHFDSLSTDLDTNSNNIYKLNSLLPRDISVASIRKVKPDANARFSAISRTYKYFISLKKDPFSEDSSWYLYGNINVREMNTASEVLLKYSDFTSFCRLHSNSKTNICKIDYARWTKKGDRLTFTITADRFLRNMVRAIVGTLIEIGSGKLSTEEFEEIIKATDRGRAGKSVPAKGLFLTDIKYPEDIFI